MHLSGREEPILTPTIMYPLGVRWKESDPHGTPHQAFLLFLGHLSPVLVSGEKYVSAIAVLKSALWNTVQFRQPWSQIKVFSSPPLDKRTTRGG